MEERTVQWKPRGGQQLSDGYSVPHIRNQVLDRQQPKNGICVEPFSDGKCHRQPSELDDVTHTLAPALKIQAAQVSCGVRLLEVIAHAMIYY